MADHTKSIEQYVNSKLPSGVKIDGRWVDIQTVPIPDDHVYFDHYVEVTAKNPPNDPSQWGHAISLIKRPGDLRIVGVQGHINCENHNLFAAGRWYGIRLTVLMNRMLSAAPVAPESSEANLVERIDSNTRT